MRRFGIGLLGAIAGYVVGALAGGYLIYTMSSNQHDRSVEAAMTGAFVFGPLTALGGVVYGLVRAKR